MVFVIASVTLFFLFSFFEFVYARFDEIMIDNIIFVLISKQISSLLFGRVFLNSRFSSTESRNWVEWGAFCRDDFDTFSFLEGLKNRFVFIRWNFKSYLNFAIKNRSSIISNYNAFSHHSGTSALIIEPSARKNKSMFRLLC